MNLLPFGDLPPYQPRRFVPATVRFDDWSQLQPLFHTLLDRLPQAANLPALEQWLLDWGELSAVLDEESSRRYIAMTCHTDNADAEAAYLHFVEHIDPELKTAQFKLARAFLDHPLRTQLPTARYHVFDRDATLQVRLFREENVPLQTEEDKLGQQYQKLIGSLTVQFRGQEQTLVQMGRHLEDPDRALREESWTVSARRRLEAGPDCDILFDKLVRLRERIATNAGFANYRDYAFQARHRFDYTPDDCLRFHEAIESELMPLVRERQLERRAKLGVPTLRPWDLQVDPLSQPALRPFTEVNDLLDRTERIFDRLDGRLADEFRQMRTLRLLDLANRKGKAPGGYQSSLGEARLPFIFMNAIGLQRDVETLLHEAGHAFHTLATQAEPLYAYRHAPIEFCEVASMSMELLGNEFLEEFYSAPDANRARQDHLDGILKFFPWMASIDAFQHWLYTHPGHTTEDRIQAWNTIMDRFGGAVDWSGFEDVRSRLWHRQLHLFLHPFYYVEYGIAQLGALQIWKNSRGNRTQALARYRQGLALGGSQPLPALFTTAGCRFDFSTQTLRPLIQLVREELQRLDQ